MTYEEYKNLFDVILNNPQPAPPYNKENIFHFTKLNKARVSRWDKQLVLDENLVFKLKQISKPQHWIIISEHWCGDAAPLLPFLIRMTGQNTLITYEIQLRDSEPFLINQYLTGGTRSIPKLIVRNAEGTDLFTWGARPREAQELRDHLIALKTDSNSIKIALQNWYNKDKGKSLCQEILQLLELKG